MTRNRRGQEPTHYEPERLAREADAMGAAYWQRQVRFGWAVFQIALWFLVVRLIGTSAIKVAFARWLRFELIRFGAVFIKLGQMLSTRVDAFPPEVLDELAHLQDKVPSFPFDQVQAIIEEEFGEPAHMAFHHIDPTPLAAASMGQVHAAVLPNGQECVIKVLRPGLEAGFARDLTLMRRFAGWVSRQSWLLKLFVASPDTPWVTLVDRLGVSLYQQLDLWTEGLHGEKFARNFEGWDRVSAPAIFWTHSSTRVLTQERVYGFRFDDEQGIRAAGVDYGEIAALVMRAFTKQVFEDCFFHADSHPGNLFVTTEGNVIYLDFGMVEYIDEVFQQQLVEMFIHVIQQDWERFLDDMVRAGVVPVEAPRELLMPIFVDVFSAQLGHSGRHYTLQEVSDKFYAIVRNYPLRLPERFLFLTRNTATLEGVVFRADPDFKFLPIALPFFAKLVLSRVDAENPWILQDMLRASENGAAFSRMFELVKMAVADEPEQMTGVVESLVGVVLHPKAAPLRAELKERLLSGSLDGLEQMIPENFTLPPGAIQAATEFLMSPAGRDWAIAIMEDHRFPGMVGRLMQGQRLPADLPVDLVTIFLHWFPPGTERLRAYRIVQTLLSSPDFPWHSVVDPRQSLQTLQLTSTVPRAEHLPALFEFLGQRGTLPLLAKGVIKGWSDRLTGRGTRPLLGDRDNG